ncbi:hypothetical protein [Chryseobacterium luquanense]|uniref:hypothetical protein n=1 Tax=Chryseobacterium luquanense TaxID=2983766 RepID=UPI002265E1E6|nr:hypothetical protein [Chryseobacterium luquanense]
MLNRNVQKRSRHEEVDCPENGQVYGKTQKTSLESSFLIRELLSLKLIPLVYYEGSEYLSEELIHTRLGW